MKTTKRFFSIVGCILILCCIPSPLTFANVDIKHNCTEEVFLSRNNWLETTCKSQKPTCKKYLVRYEDAEHFAQYLKDMSEVNSGQSFKNFALWLAQITGVCAGGVAAAGGGFIFLKSHPIVALLTASFASASSIAYNKIFAPTGESANNFIEIVTWPVNYLHSLIFGSKPKVDNPESGIVGRTTTYLYGSSEKEKSQSGIIELTREYLFGKTPVEKNIKPKLYKEMLKSFLEQIKSKKWENNNFIIASIDEDQKAPQAVVQFEHSLLQILYDKDKSEYFKNIL